MPERDLVKSCNRAAIFSVRKSESFTLHRNINSLLSIYGVTHFQISNKRVCASRKVERAVPSFIKSNRRSAGAHRAPECAGLSKSSSAASPSHFHELSVARTTAALRITVDMALA